MSAEGRRGVRWLCKCECGNTIVVARSDLRNGDTKSCGCYKRDCDTTRGVTHGQSKTPLYVVWKGVRARCYNPNHKNYLAYGGRGISMCEDWRKNFESFRDWMIENGYDGVRKLSIDRIDNDGNYEPNNCRLVASVVQANNRRSNKYITHNGETHNLKWWSDHTGIPYGNIYHRFTKGWDTDKILTA